MKKVLLLAILVTSSLFAQAQKGKKSPEERAQARVEKISQELNLSDTQEQEIYELFLSEGKKGLVEGKNIRDLNKDERQAYINAKKEEKAAIYEKIADILDTDQFATFQTMDRTRKPVRTSSKGKGKGKKDPANRVENKVERLTEELSLTPNQQTQVRDLLLAQQAAQQGKKAQGKDLTKEEREANKEAWKAAKVANEENLKTILNADQLATYEANKASRGERGNGTEKRMKEGGKSVENRVQKLTEKLQLSEIQQDQVSSILTKHHEARIAKGENQALSDEAKEARKAARKEAKAQLDAEMKAVLSAEQYATYQKEDKGRGKKIKSKKKWKKNKNEE